MTQVTTPDNIPSPDLTDQYALTQDMANLADATQAALVRRANLYKGSGSQRVAFTSATEGTHWQDTDGSKGLFVFKGGRWVGGRSSANLPFQAPFSPYSVGGVVLTLREGNMVQISGTATISSSSLISGSNEQVLATVPVGFRPSASLTFPRMQGSGSESWLLSVTPDGVLKGARYSGTGSNLWLPFHATWIASE